MTKKTNTNFDSLLEKAWGKFSKKDYDAALQLFEDILEEDQDHEGAIFGRASVMLRTDEIESAISDFDSLIKADPKNSRAYHARGLAYGAEQKHKLALKDFEKASDLDSNNLEVWSDMGGTYLVLEDYVKAGKCFDNCTTLDKNCSLGWYGKGMIALMKKDYKKAVELFTTTLKLDSKLVSALLARADAYFELQKNDLALKDIKKAKDIQPDILKSSDTAQGHDTDEFDYESDEENTIDDDTELDEY